MTTDGPLDERYLEWLYSFIGNVRNRNPARSHWLLIEQLYHIEFEWFVPNDDNRIADGIDLREEFLVATGAERNQPWLEEGCSVTEMLVALCRRAEYESAQDSYYWFQRILDNLGIREYTDDQYDEEVNQLIHDIIDVMIARTYRADGVGGLFPLKHPDRDQREVEIWYQMAAYLLENGYD